MKLWSVAFVGGNHEVQRCPEIVIEGGETAGLMTAGAPSSLLKLLDLHIDVVEPDEIGTAGVGAATITHIRSCKQR
ncbi:hypothetical protein BZG35_16625 [Brevundimonas sp. LM2]|nr:tryptophan 7-halogenase [Brevundimonas sp. LM2]AQR63096.1 hypothetical protein BZG35_16625 [Brevundimonas sp. LM2]